MRAPIAVALVICALALWPGCNRSVESGARSMPDPADELRFVRDGFVLPHASAAVAMVGGGLTSMKPRTGLRFGDDLFLVDHSAPGTRIYTKHVARLRLGHIPENPSPWEIATMPLESVKSVALSGNLADSCVALAGTLVATGTYTGKLHLHDLLGRTADRTINSVTAGMVKSLAFPQEPMPRPFPPDGSIEPDRIFVGAQSPTGHFGCLNLTNGAELWGFDVADDLGAGQLPKADDPYGIYSLPAVWQILTDGSTVYLVGVHAGRNPDGTKFNRARLYAYTLAGQRKWAWPAEGPAQVNILRFAIAGTTVLLATSRSTEAPEDPVYLDRAVYQLDRASGQAVAHLQIPSLPGFRDRAFIWQSLGLTGDGRIAVVGLNDGRGIILDLADPASPEPAIALRRTLDLGMPIDTAGVSLTAPVSYALCVDDTCYFQTGGSNIPPGASSSATSPPAPHPGANTLTAITASTGATLWRYQAENEFNGLATDTVGRWLLTTTGNPTYPEQSGGYGVLVFDTFRTGEGAARIAWQQPLEGPAFFNIALSPDGFICAVTETPVVNPDQVSVRGTYQTHVYH